jgi:hypothetical protein
MDHEKSGLSSFFFLSPAGLIMEIYELISLLQNMNTTILIPIE